MRILLATDGSDHAAEAARFLLRLPFASDPALQLLSVLETRGLPAEIELRTGASVPLVAALRDRAGKILADQERVLQPRFSNIETRVREGNAADQIVESAEEWGCDLVVSGAHGEHGLAGLLLGSVSYRVLQHAPCSVLLVRPPVGPPPSRLRIALGTDGSESSRSAAAFLKDSGMTAGCRLELVRVLATVRAFRMDIVQQTSRAWIKELSAARAHLSQLRELLAGADAEICDHLLEGDSAGEALTDFAKKSNLDLIAVGSKGSGAIGRFLLGSVSTTVAHHAPCSVLVVKNPS